jgi:4-hydroxyacetophenone monooxygenase
MKRRIPAAAAPVSEDDAFIAAALERANLPTLLMSIIHLSGDLGILDGPIRPGPALLGDAQSGISEADKAAVRRRALFELCAYRDRGCTLPPPPPREKLHEMMSFMVGQEVPEAYTPMMLEEMALDGRDQRDVAWDARVTDAAKQAFPVLVIGAGMSGLLAAIRLGDAGIPYTVVEKNETVGGTWLENTYPGCRVDIANHFYCYSFEPNYDWSEFFSQRKELHEYFERVATKYGVREHIRFRIEVVSARWDEVRGDWEVALRGSDGREERQRYRAIVSAVGQLNRPRIPDFPGLARFEGPAFHSARFEHQHDLQGLRVAMIGTGASAFQLGPELAKTADRLLVFQRSPAWMLPNPDYHARVSPEKKWLLEHVPFYARWYRFLLFWPGSDGLMPALIIDPEWPHPERSVNALNEATRVFFTDYMKSQVGDRPDLLEKVVPKYPPFGKRMLQDNGSWLATLKRENVDLVTEGIREIRAKSIVTEDDAEHPVDVIVFATGFHANRFLWPIEVTGRGGVALGALWGDDPRAYLGITVPRFPNLFCLYGPATNLAHAGSIIFHSECQVRYVMGCIRGLLERGATTLECRQDVCDAFNEKLDAALARTVWSHPGMNSWYKNSKGRVTTTSPWLLRDYWTWTKEPDFADFVLS